MFFKSSAKQNEWALGCVKSPEASWTIYHATWNLLLGGPIYFDNPCKIPRPSSSTAGNSAENTNSGNGLESETIFTKVKRKSEKEEEELGELDAKAKVSN